MKNFYTFFICFFSIVYFSDCTAQTIRYVRQDGTGNGTSWANASGNLQAIINASAANDEIWVATGVYKPVKLISAPTDQDDYPNDRRCTFTLKGDLKLYGGFPGLGNPTMDDRDFILNPTILSGDIGVENEITDNCFHVLFYPAINNTILDGFTITSGVSNGVEGFQNMESYVPYLSINIVNYRGGGIYIHNGDNHQFSNCRFVNNRSNYEGGGIYIQSGGNHQFTVTKFENNKGGGYGGAIYANQSTINVAQCEFKNNETVLQSGGTYPMPTPDYYASGGAISIKNGNLNAINNLFIENKAKIQNNTTNAQGGALHLLNGNHTISGNTFSKNEATYLPTGVQVCLGGAIYFVEGTSALTNNVFTENLSHGTGGAVYFGGGQHHLNANRFTQNLSVGNGAAISCSSTTITSTNNIFNLNASQSKGGAVFSAYTGGTNRFVNNTFYSNVSNQAFGGGAMYFENRIDHVLNNIFYQNKVINSTTNPGADIAFANSNGSTFLNNFYQTSSSSSGNLGYEYDTPNMADPTNGIFMLLSNSPCINMGSNNHYLSTYSPTDFSGNLRIFNKIIDMGAHEYRFPLSIQDPADHEIKPEITLFPNPISQNQKVTIQSLVDSTIEIYDILGKSYQQIKLTQGLNEFEHTLLSGIYFIKTQTGYVTRLIVK